MLYLLPILSFASAALAIPSPAPVDVTSLFKRHHDTFNNTKIGSDGSFFLSFSSLSLLLAPKLIPPFDPLFHVAWKALYPSVNGTPTYSPQIWLDKLAEVEMAGLLPDASVNPAVPFNATAGK